MRKLFIIIAAVLMTASMWAADFSITLEKAELGNVNAQFDLGFMYDTGKGVAQDYAQAAYWYRKAADQGLKEAQFMLGFLYQTGKGVDHDYTQAAYWFQKAADQGLAYAQSNLGIMYKYGTGVTQDFKQAAYWFRKAAIQEHASSQYELGLMYEDGLGVSQDDVLAAAWYKKAAEHGHAKAQFSLGYMYDLGKGVAEDYAQAVYWYQKAAEQKEADAQYFLGSMYYEGKGVAQDYAQAAYWFRKAADQGYAKAQNALGTMYEDGLGVEMDFVEAANWYKKAADRGYKKGADNYERLLAEAEKYTPGNYVDLGLPSGTLWQDKNAINRINYSEYSPQIKLEEMLEDCCVPTADQFAELIKYCTWKWDGKGYTITGKNGQSIYLPANGYVELQQWFNEADPTPEKLGVLGWYWTSTRTKEDSDEQYYALAFDDQPEYTMILASKNTTCMSIRLVHSKTK